jgi:hypothetical protein
MITTTPIDRIDWTSALLRRWPTVLGIALAALVLTGDDVQQSVSELVPLLALEYLIVAKLGRRDATWPVVGVLFVGIVAAMSVDGIPLPAVLAAIALVVLVWSAVDGQLFRSGEFQLQALGMIGFGALALVGLVVDPDVGRYVVAAAWLLHGIWDFVHIRRDRVVTRSYAEWCGVVDILVAFSLVFVV